jgi:hypothetical protein
LRYAAILSDAENHDRWSVENARVGCSASRIASHEKDGDGCEDLASVHRTILYLYSQALFNAADECRGISWRRLQWANGATSENYSAAKAMVTNAPPCRQKLHFSTTQLHLSHGIVASQWICRASARNTGKANSYQCSVAPEGRRLTTACNRRRC